MNIYPALFSGFAFFFCAVLHPQSFLSTFQIPHRVPEACFSSLTAPLKSLRFAPPRSLGKHSALQGQGLRGNSSSVAHLEQAECSCSLILKVSRYYWSRNNIKDGKGIHKTGKKVHLLLPWRGIWPEGSEHNSVLFDFLPTVNLSLSSFVDLILSCNQLHSCTYQTTKLIQDSEFPMTAPPYSGNSTQAAK